jgi:hypothetical protein
MIFNKVWFAKFMVFFGYLMSVIYIGLGVSLFIPNVFNIQSWEIKFAFAIFLIAYGFYRLVKQITKQTEPND